MRINGITEILYISFTVDQKIVNKKPLTLEAFTPAKHPLTIINGGC